MPTYVNMQLIPRASYMMQNFVDFIMPFSIAIIMLGIGLELKFKDFKRVFIQPKAVICGIVAQLIILPLIAFIIASLWDLSIYQKVGILLLAACPGGTASNLVTKMLGGRIALSISMTAFNSFIILFTIPSILSFALWYFANEQTSVDMKFWQTTGQVFFTVIIPVLVGILINNLVDRLLVERLRSPLKYILPAILLIALIAVAFLDDASKSINYLQHLNLYLPLLLLNITTMTVGFSLARFIKLTHKSSYTIAIELGLQNSVLALFIAQQLGNPEVNLMAILYSSFSFISTLLIAYALKLILK